MGFVEGLSVFGAGTLVSVLGLLMSRPGPKRWRYWFGSLIAIGGIGLAIYAAMSLLSAR